MGVVNRRLPAKKTQPRRIPHNRIITIQPPHNIQQVHTPLEKSVRNHIQRSMVPPLLHTQQPPITNQLGNTASNQRIMHPTSKQQKRETTTQNTLTRRKTG